jgi:hypothetical protein
MKARAVLLLSLMIAGFLWGLAALLSLRFEGGDVYAEFSSLRSDPAGSRAFFESLASLPGLSVERNFLPVSRLEPSPDSAVLFLGLEAASVDFAERASVERLEASVRGGTRLLVALYPGGQNEVSRTPTKTRNRETRSRITPRRGKESEPEPPFVSLSERWGFRIQSAPLGSGPAVAEPRLPLSLSVPWRSAFWFRAVSPSWRAVYEREAHRPVVLERPLGKGTIVLCSDSSFATNLALLRERRTELLAWLLDGKRKVIFDETHLGISESPGVAALARRYRLEGFAAGVLALALLFLWKNAVPFPRPSGANAADGAIISGRRAFDGLAAVLSRNVSPSHLLETCAAEWRKTLSRGGSGWEAEIEAVEVIVRGETEGPRRERDPAAGYRRIAQSLAAKRRVRGGAKP